MMMIQMRTPRIPNQIDDDEPRRCPRSAAAIPRSVNVSAEPRAYTAESDRAFLGAVSPPTYARTRGSWEREQGVTDVTIPAMNATSGAVHPPSDITEPRNERTESINDKLLCKCPE